MSNMFFDAKFFRGDISKWDVSNVRDMSGMFMGAKGFNSDLSKWEVSRVTNMPSMFRNARSFDGDISKWDVSRVINMDYMFSSAASFKQKLCGTAWVHSKASKAVMFAGSPGAISRTVCTSSAAFSPQSKEELKGAVDAYLDVSPDDNDCSDGPHGTTHTLTTHAHTRHDPNANANSNCNPNPNPNPNTFTQIVSKMASAAKKKCKQHITSQPALTHTSLFSCSIFFFAAFFVFFFLLLSLSAVQNIACIHCSTLLD